MSEIAELRGLLAEAREWIAVEIGVAGNGYNPDPADVDLVDRIAAALAADAPADKVEAGTVSWSGGPPTTSTVPPIASPVPAAPAEPEATGVDWLAYYKALDEHRTFWFGDSCPCDDEWCLLNGPRPAPVSAAPTEATS